MLLASFASAQDVSYNFDQKADFTKFKTYKWVAVKDGEQLDELTAKMVVQAIETQLTAKGLKKVESGDADLLVAYQVAVNKEKEVTTFGTGYGMGPAWGGRWYGGYGAYGGGVEHDHEHDHSHRLAGARHVRQRGEDAGVAGTGIEADRHQGEPGEAPEEPGQGHGEALEELSAPGEEVASDSVAAMTSGYDEAYRAFRQAFAGYSGGSRLDHLRATDYERLDRLGHVYLDYTGGSLHAASQLQRHADLLQNTVLGNPHSNNPTSLEASRLVDRARASVLRFFNADPAQYDVIFTPNATGALKLVGEAYPFEAGGRLVLTYDNHNSVNGLREFARRRGARVTYLPVLTPDLRVDGDAALAELGQTTTASPTCSRSPRSPTSAACSTRSSGSRRRRTPDGR